MQGKHWLVVLAMLVLTACEWKQRNAYHCPGGSECPPPGGPCASSGDCEAPTPLCNEATMTCVQCLEDRHCVAATPVCSAENTCVECEQDADCASGLCLPEQKCAAPEQVAFVDGDDGVDNEECPAAMPCKTLKKALMLMPHREYIKATGMIAEDMAVVIDRRTVSIFGNPGMTTITRMGMGGAPALEIKNNSVVTLVDLEIIAPAAGNAVELKMGSGPMVLMNRVKVRGNSGNGIQIETGKLELNESQVSQAAAAGINVIGGSLVMTGSQVFNNQQDGIKAASGTTVEIRRSLIFGNKGTAGVFTTDASMVTIEASTIALNTGSGGGVSIMGRFTIRNSIIARNGGGNSTTGGLNLISTNGVLEFSTIADNLVQSGGTGGISCSGTIAISSVIHVNNAGIIDPGCNFTYSLTSTMGSALPGDGNTVGEPMFIEVMNPESSSYYRIRKESAARNRANSNLPVDVDIDGEPRDDGMKDMGADEFKP